MQADEITGIVGRLLAKERSKPAAVLDDIDAIELPAAEPWPEPPAVALRHGVVGEIMDAVMPATEADPVAVLVTLLVAFGNAAGRGPHALVGATRHGVNLFSAIVGRSGKGRKGTGLDIALHLLRAGDPAWAEERLVSGLSSGEGVVHAIRDPVTRMEPVREGRAIVDYAPVVVDHGIEDKRLLVVEPELGSALRHSRREQSILSPMLRQSWDGSKIRTLSKNSPEIATDPHISIVGHVVVEELRKLLSDADIFGGLANRFLWILSRRSKLLPDGGDLADTGPLAARLADLLTRAKATGAMRRTPAAAVLWRDQYARLTTVPESGVVGAALGRGEAQALRLSMLFALLAGRREIDKADLLAAVDLWEYAATSARIIFATTGPDAPLDARILEIVRSAPGIGRSGLHKALGGRTPARELVAALGRLRDVGAIVATSTRTSGRPAETWAPATTPNFAKEEISPTAETLLSSFADSQPAPGLERRVL